MRLTDIMSHANLTIFAEIAFVIVFIAFILIIARVFLKKDWSEESEIPLTDDVLTPRDDESADSAPDAAASTDPKPTETASDAAEDEENHG
ncbi:MAG: hypothetical protein H6684_01275 [Deltaproteobacteria bacterium]|nr:hypothetical protein [Deltaproteobacteria bacterium]